MSAPVKSNSLQAYQVILYGKAVHPELFRLKARRVIQHGGYELEGWVMQGSHLLRFEHGPLCASELLTDQDKNLPTTGIVTAFLCAGERDYEHSFEREGVTYINSVQTESLSENLYIATYQELLDDARHQNGLIHEWEDESGRCLSAITFESRKREVHSHAFHLMAGGGVVVRSQTIFEIE